MLECTLFLPAIGVHQTSYAVKLALDELAAVLSTSGQCQAPLAMILPLTELAGVLLATRRLLLVP